MVALAVEPELVGAQSPRVSWLPVADELDWAIADECLAWTRDVLGVRLDPWETLTLRAMLATRPGGRWNCFEFGLLVSRQNGKSLIFVIRALFALFVLRQERVVYSSHRGDTAREQYQAAISLIEDADLMSWHPYSSAGRESIEHLGRVLKFKTRSKTGGRGLGGDTLILDEAQELTDDQFQAVSPILAARTMVGNPQMIYGGSAGNRKSAVWSRVRRRALNGGDQRLGFLEWSIDELRFLAASPARQRSLACDLALIAQANPALGIVREDGTGGISPEYLLGQVEALGIMGFAAEHLGVGDWPLDDTTDWPIPRLAWQDCEDMGSPAPDGRLVLALDVTPDRSWSAIAVVGNSDGTPYGGLVEPGGHEPGTGWVLPRLLELKKAHRPVAIVLDPHGPAGALVAPLEAAGLELHAVTTIEASHACGGLYDAAVTGRLKHRGQPALDAALAGAKRRALGDGWAWDRRTSTADISPLVAFTLAHWGFHRFGGAAPSPEIF